MDQQHGVRRVGLATGVSVPYVSVGPSSAAPVVLLHAWGESWHSFDRLLPLLPRTIHAVAMDLRGHGDADKPAAGYSLVDVAADVVAFMDAVGVCSAVLVGSSSGGYVGAARAGGFGHDSLRRQSPPAAHLIARTQRIRAPSRR